MDCSPARSCWPSEARWSIQVLVFVDMSRNRMRRSRKKVQILFSLQPATFCAAVNPDGRFITEDHYVLFRLLYCLQACQFLIQPFHTLIFSQNVAVTFTHTEIRNVFKSSNSISFILTQKNTVYHRQHIYYLVVFIVFFFFPKQNNLPNKCYLFPQCEIGYHNNELNE